MDRSTHSQNHTQGNPHNSPTSTPNSDASPLLFEHDWATVPYTHDDKNHESDSQDYISRVDKQSLTYISKGHSFFTGHNHATVKLGG